MEGLSIIIFIIIGIVSSVMKQQQKQQQEQHRHRPVRKEVHIPEQLEKTVMDMENSYMPSPFNLDKNEGVELEDRRRTGSLDYTPLSRSDEGVCNEHPEHMEKKKKKTVPKTEIKIEKEDSIFEITEDNLINSIIMAEIIGPPRSMKRNIR